MPKVIGGSVRSHREHVTAQIFEAVRSLLYERGYDALSLADVAEACGMARTAMYNYFPDKAALIVAYATHETDRYLVRLDAALRPVDNPVEQLRTYLRLQLEYFSGNHLPPGPALRLLLPEGASDEVLAHVALIEDRLHDIVVAGRDRRYLLADDTPATVAMISACISRASDVADDGASLEETIAATETFVLRAVGANIGPDGAPRRLRRR